MKALIETLYELLFLITITGTIFLFLILASALALLSQQSEGVVA